MAIKVNEGDRRSLAALIGDSDPAVWPQLHDAERADRLRAHLAEAGLEAGTPLTDCLARIASGSPYLDRLFRRQSDDLLALLQQPPDEAMAGICEAALAAGKTPEAPVTLRRLKKSAAMLLSMLDLSGLYGDTRIMRYLSEFADAAVAASFEHALRETAGAGEEPCLPNSGLCVYAMGKHGAHELNYSSDIDLVIFHDTALVEAFIAGTEMPERMRETRRFLTRVVQLAVSTLHDQTVEGYVFRTDLRLRPDPGSSAVSVSVSSAEHYYESYGQNWERAAFIKARMIAGDERTGQQMEAILTPFVWRRYLDFTAIEDIHSIKRQIHAQRGQADFTFPGHDIKLGRGGIREIEFFAQTQQLILGGRDESLREPETLNALGALAAAGHITGDSRDALSAAYLYLRHIEHRIQMVNDEQTHVIPEAPGEIERLAKLSGYDTSAPFEERLVETLKTVHDHYADLFHEEEDLSAGIGSLVFTGVDHDPGTLRTLADLGFEKPEVASATVRKWHAAGMRATRSARGRALLTKLVPSIIRACSQTDDPDAALAAFDGFLRNMPAGIQIFSLMLNNLEVLDLIAGLVSRSPRLAREMAVHARLVEVLLDEAFLEREEGEIIVDEDALVAATLEEPDYEDALNALRRKDRELWFKISCRLLLGRSRPAEASRALTALADAGVAASLAIARREMEEAHGPVDGAVVIIGMGRLGAASLTATSDLDLIFIYETPEGAKSAGPKELDGTTWFTRLVRRTVTALSAQTGEGGLYEIDMALRPSGGSGPAAVSRKAFELYYDKDAWVWEEMALTKARIVAGDDVLGAALADRIEEILTRKRDAAATAEDVIDMRRRLLAAKPAKSPLDVKHAHGGLTDIDFICQYLSLTHAHEKGRFPAHMRDALPVMADLDLIEEAHAETLSEAAAAYETVIQVLRMALDRGADPALAPHSARALIAELIGLDDPDTIEDWLSDRQERVRALFDSLVGPLS